MIAYSILVAGAPGAGRHAFVAAVADMVIATTGWSPSAWDPVEAAADRGWLPLEPELALDLVVTDLPPPPGDQGRRVVGAVLLVAADAVDRPDPAYVDALPRPLVVAVRAGATPPELDSGPPAVEVDPTDRESVKRVLLALLDVAAAALA